jgi:hypothetical protein
MSTVRIILVVLPVCCIAAIVFVQGAWRLIAGERPKRPGL